MKFANYRLLVLPRHIRMKFVLHEITVCETISVGTCTVKRFQCVSILNDRGTTELFEDQPTRGLVDEAIKVLEPFPLIVRQRDVFDPAMVVHRVKKGAEI